MLALHQSKRNGTNELTLLHAKNIQNWCNFMGKHTVCVQISPFIPKGSLFNVILGGLAKKIAKVIYE